MNSENLHILLADDDHDDCLLFKEALEELPLSASLTTVHDGEKLMALLSNDSDESHQVLFLDLNMPRKNGFECLAEMKLNDRLKKLPVIIFSTSFEEGVVDLIYASGAHYYFKKPTEFSELKRLINESLSLLEEETILQPARENFVLGAQNRLVI